MMSEEKTRTTRTRKREEWDKKGKYKYLMENLRRIHRDISELRTFLRYLAKGLERVLVFDKFYLAEIACSDEIDREILETLWKADCSGVLPRDVALKLTRFKLNPWNVTQRIRRMNRKVSALLGQELAEKRGLRWALTSFAERSWGATENEIKAEEENTKERLP